MSEKNGIPNKPIISYSEKIGVRIHLDFTRPSPIQTILSALESHQILPLRLAGLEDSFITAGWEFHPAPKD